MEPRQANILDNTLADRSPTFTRKFAKLQILIRWGERKRVCTRLWGRGRSERPNTPYQLQQLSKGVESSLPSSWASLAVSCSRTMEDPRERASSCFGSLLGGRGLEGPIILAGHVQGLWICFKKRKRKRTTRTTMTIICVIN